VRGITLENSFQPQRHRDTEKIQGVAPKQPLTGRVSSHFAATSRISRILCVSVVKNLG